MEKAEAQKLLKECWEAAQRIVPLGNPPNSSTATALLAQTLFEAVQDVKPRMRNRGDTISGIREMPCMRFLLYSDGVGNDADGHLICKECSFAVLRIFPVAGPPRYLHTVSLEEPQEVTSE